MPITLEKLLSPTAETSFEFMGETVNVTFAPMRYTGEMQDFAERLSEEEEGVQAKVAELRAEAETVLADAGKGTEAQAIAAARAAELTGEASALEQKMDLADRKALRDLLSKLLVGWDVMEGRKPLKTDRDTLDRLPDIFLRFVYISLARENQPDPPKAPTSERP